MRAKEKKTYEQIIKQNEELCKQNALLKEQIEQLLERIKKLEKENQELKERLNKNSANSSKPPSSDGPRRSTKPKRPKSRHNNGGQPGHKGSCLKPVEKPDETIELTLEKSPAGAPLSQSDIIGWQRRQVFDIPEPRIEVTEYARAIYRCPQTGKKCQADFPPEAGANVQYGSRIRALAIYLLQRQLIPLERTQEVLQHLYAMSPSQQTILKSCEKSHTNLANFENQLKQRLLKEDLLHADETGARLQKKKPLDTRLLHPETHPDTSAQRTRTRSIHRQRPAGALQRHTTARLPELLLQLRCLHPCHLRGTPVA